MALSLTPTQFPYTGPYSVEGYGKHRGNTALSLKRFCARIGILPWEPDKWDNNFNSKLENGLDEYDPGKDGYAEGRWIKIRAEKLKNGEFALDSVCRSLVVAEYNASVVKVPNLGPIYNGGPSFLKYDLTHETDGIDLYPAFDTAFAKGTGIIAPEDMIVIDPSSSRPGLAFFAKGASGLKYWFGHLDRTHYVGKHFSKYDLVGKVAQNYISTPHCHVGINVENLWGSGKELIHHTNYTHGAPLIGAQLEAHFLL